jgi:hypothetical protein
MAFYLNRSSEEAFFRQRPEPLSGASAFVAVFWLVSSSASADDRRALRQQSRLILWAVFPWSLEAQFAANLLSTFGINAVNLKNVLRKV